MGAISRNISGRPDADGICPTVRFAGGERDSPVVLCVRRRGGGGLGGEGPLGEDRPVSAEGLGMCSWPVPIPVQRVYFRRSVGKKQVSGTGNLPLAAWRGPSPSPKRLMATRPWTTGVPAAR